MQAPDAPLWQRRVRVAEALVLLALARLSVATLPFGIWRRWAGRAAAPSGRSSGADAGPIANLAGDSSANTAQTCAAAMERAAQRLPGSLCLPQAIALQWMLRRRKMECTIMLGVIPGQRRGLLGDLHAWVEADGIVLIGGDLANKDGPEHRPVLALTTIHCPNDKAGRR
jgi:hypothetical protein